MKPPLLQRLRDALDVLLGCKVACAQAPTISIGTVAIHVARNDAPGQIARDVMAEIGRGSRSAALS